MKKYLLSLTAVLVLLSCNSEKKYEKSSGELLASMVYAQTYAEAITGRYSKVWRDAISKEVYYKIDGKEVKSYIDFNDALVLVKSEMQHSGLEGSLDSSFAVVDSIMRTLNEPPKKYEKLSKDISECYGDLSEFIRLAKAPEGSLMSYNQRSSELNSSFNRKISQIAVQLPK